MPRLIAWGYWGLVGLVLTACASPQTRVLGAAIRHETQTFVAERLGPPHEVWELADGETLWSYRLPQRLWAYGRAGHTHGSPGGMTIEGPGLTVLPGVRCTEYVLRFDREQILRVWRRQPCRGFEPGPVATP